ncbi:MAG: polysaccharide pyruvyl transferase family protein [Paludibacteraceae bacterium]|nr:polysaccharide pyruvyl transferase family protein [Paludibacteraceae bacterium]MCK9615538.1 polysaccharide pyruvyl transferase family protein [Candidatus Omnitrophota bacterium]
MEYIFANWCLSSNVGDQLTPYLVEKISGKKCVFCDQNSRVLKYVVVGSILNWEIKNAVFWGTGIADSKDNIGIKDIRSVRGYISKTAAMNFGNDCYTASVGDPALILPKIYSSDVKKTNSLAIVPHYIDLEYFVSKFGSRIRIINPLQSVENFIDEICSCESILSSSLHGLIIAEAYGVKTRWVKFGNRIGGDGTKFRDHYSSINTVQECLDLSEFNGKFEEIESTRKKIPDDLVSRMLETCPFRGKI